jgi:putative membrane protein
MKLAKKTAGIGAIAIAALLAGCDRDQSEESPASDNPASSAPGITSNPRATIEGQSNPPSGGSTGAPTQPAGGSGSGAAAASGQVGASSGGAGAGMTGTTGGSGTAAGGSGAAAGGSGSTGGNSGTAGAGSATGAGTGGAGIGTDPKGTANAAAAAAAQGSAEVAAKVGPAAAGSDNTPTLSPKDREFVMQASSSGMLEVEAGRLAAENATDPRVRAFASMLVVEHSRTNAELNVLASMRNLVLPGDMSAEKRAALDRLRNASGADFDREFVASAGIKAHEEAIALFEGAQGSVSDTALKEWIEKTLPALRQHLEQARKLPGGA